MSNITLEVKYIEGLMEDWLKRQISPSRNLNFVKHNVVSLHSRKVKHCSIPVRWFEVLYDHDMHTF